MIIVEYFSNRDLHAFIFEGSKERCWVLMTQKMIKKEGYCMRDCILFKSGLKEKFSKILEILIQEKKIE
jgi:hypothetical protein